MNPRDRIALDPVPRMQPEDDFARALASFVSESALVETAFTTEQTTDPLSEFPEEVARLSAAANEENEPVFRKVWISSASAWLAAAVLIAAVAGVWWAGLISRRDPAAPDATVQAMVMSPAIPPPDPVIDSPAQLTQSTELRGSTRPPVASSLQNVRLEEVNRIATPPRRPIGLPGGAPEHGDPQQRATSMTRGTSGGALADLISTVAPRPTEPVSVAPSAAIPVVRLPEPDPLPASEAPASVPLVSRLPMAAARPEPEALPSVVARSERSEIQRTLGQYRSAYQKLDAEAARAVWPSVDVRALARAFDTLASQELAFETCQFDIGEQAATAECRGSATYTPNIGSRAPRLEPRQWTFHLRKVDEAWKIQSAQTRR